MAPLVSKIIQQVKAHPEVWQITHRRYKDKTARELAWKQIGKAVGKDDVMLRKRWKNLKDAFRKELKRILVKEIETSSWHYFEELSFITEPIMKGIGKKDISTYTNDAHDANDANDGDDPRDDGDTDDPLTVKTEILEIEPTTSVDIDIDSAYTNDYHGNDKLMNASNHNGNVMKQLRRKRKVSDYKYDADYMFLVSLVPIMRKLSDVQKLQFRGQVNQWLLDALSSVDHQKYRSKMIREDSDESFE